MKLVYRITGLLLLAFYTSAPIMASGNKNDEFETLMEKIREDFAQNPLIDEALNKYDTSKGCFTDVDYSRRDRTNWEPLTHIPIRRTLTIKTRIFTIK